MNDGLWYARTELIAGSEGIERLNKAHVLVAGLGGVGAVVAETLVRAGIGTITLADSDVFSVSNKNRHIYATDKTVGKSKVQIVTQKLKDINPEVVIHTLEDYLIDDTIHELLDAHTYDYVVDAIDTLSPKVFFIYYCLKKGFPLVSSMGAGGRIDPAQVSIGDISESHHCKLAKYVRKKLHKLGVDNGFQVVYSPEEVPDERYEIVSSKNKRTVVGTISYMPWVFGCFAASVVVREVVKG